MKECDYKKGLFEAQMSDLLGRVFTSVEREDDELKMTCADGVFRFYHAQDCCEDVYIESVVGDLSDLIGEPILIAEEVVHDNEHPPGVPAKDVGDSFTWTFYKLATRKGYVDIRWFGTSSGCYSERVSIEFTKAEEVQA